VTWGTTSIQESDYVLVDTRAGRSSTFVERLAELRS
jgi:hypothetical protein